jgi:phospholipase C
MSPGRVLARLVQDAFGAGLKLRSMRISRSGIAGLGFAMLTALVAACGGGGGSTTPTMNGPTPVPVNSSKPTPSPSSSAGIPVGVGPAKIKHVVFMVQENRSFDNIFGGVDSSGKAFPNADTVSNPLPGEPTPHDHLGHPVKMQQGLLEECYSPAHDHPEQVEEIDGGKMDGFDLDIIGQLHCAPGTPPPDYLYRYIKESEVDPYWQMGEKYAISDRMFEPISSASFGSHLYLASGQSAGTIDNPSLTPWGCDSPPLTRVNIMTGNGGEVGPGVYPCFTVPTLADVLNSRGVSWRYYATADNDYGYLWSVMDAFSQIREGPQWTTNVVNPPAQFLTDVAGGTLASMTWVTPTLVTSDHPVSTENMGPAWVASVVNAVGQSKFWDSTAVFIIWDDPGGWYDHVPPPVTGPFSLGIRVGLIVVSPYAKHGYVSHVVHSSGSILHFAETALNVPSLGQEDARSDDLTDAFDFNQKPQAFSPFAIHQSLEAVRRAATQPRQAAEGARPDDD